MICLFKEFKSVESEELFDALVDYRLTVLSSWRVVTAQIPAQTYIKGELESSVWESGWSLADGRLSRQASISIVRFIGPKKEPR